MRLSVFLSIVLFVFNSPVQAQVEEFPDYHPPLNIPLILSANFGELRPNHFHMGLDFKTQNKIGFNLYTIDDGFVSRIKVSPFGYGKVVYIDHPNGVTSVYAHCSEFKGQLDSIVKAVQEQEQDFAVEIFPKPHEIELKKGDVIALSGNTGGSTAPHLHFEIRDTKSEAAMNPLVCGFDIADHKAPEIRGFKFYSVTKDGYRYPKKAFERVAKKGTYGYYIGADKVTIPANYCTEIGGIGIAANVIDRLDGAGNQCGLYGSLLIVDGDTLFGQQTDTVPFESTRYVNSHKDFEAYTTSRKKYHKLFKTTENDLPIYQISENGILFLKPGDSHKIKYVAYDPKGNKSTVEFTLEVANGTLGSESQLPVDLTYLQPAHSMMMENENRQVEFGVATVYEPLKMNEEVLDHTIGKAAVPVHKPYTIRINSSFPDDGKTYIKMTTAKGRNRSLIPVYSDGWFIAESKYFGTYKLRRDTLGPSIRTLSFKSTSTYVSSSKMKWRISDSQSGLADYDLFIDGKWYVLEYEYKGGGSMTFNRPKGISGVKEVIVRAEDECGNVTEWKKKMTFK